MQRLLLAGLWLVATVGACSGSAAPDETMLVPYQFTYVQRAEVAGEPRERVVRGGHDPASGDGFAMATVRELTQLRYIEETDHPAQLVEQVFVGDIWFARGLVPELGYSDPIDAGAWYEGETPITSRSSDLLEGVQRFDALRERVADIVAVDDFSSADGLPAFRATLTTDARRALEGTFFAGGYGTAEWTVHANTDGYLDMLAVTPSEDPAAISVEYRFSNFGEPLTMPEVSTERQVPAIGKARESIELARSPQRAVDGVVFRFWTYGYKMSHPDNPLEPYDFNLVLQADGTLIRVDGTGVFDGAESYQVWHLTESGIERLVESLWSNQRLTLMSQSPAMPSRWEASLATPAAHRPLNSARPCTISPYDSRIRHG